MSVATVAWPWRDRRSLCVMQYVPVDTIICFRASCPIVIAIIEFLYLGRELPSFRSWASLLGNPNYTLPQLNHMLLKNLRRMQLACIPSQHASNL